MYYYRFQLVLLVVLMLINDYLVITNAALASDDIGNFAYMKTNLNKITITIISTRING
jgi:hypothetical protein